MDGKHRRMAVSPVEEYSCRNYKCMTFKDYENQCFITSYILISLTICNFVCNVLHSCDAT